MILDVMSYSAMIVGVVLFVIVILLDRPSKGQQDDRDK